jgi:hypothetical protein
MVPLPLLTCAPSVIENICAKRNKDFKWSLYVSSSNNNNNNKSRIRNKKWLRGPSCTTCPLKRSKGKRRRWRWLNLARVLLRRVAEGKPRNLYSPVNRRKEFNRGVQSLLGPLKRRRQLPSPRVAVSGVTKRLDWQDSRVAVDTHSVLNIDTRTSTTAALTSSHRTRKSWAKQTLKLWLPKSTKFETLVEEYTFLGVETEAWTKKEGKYAQGKLALSMASLLLCDTR